MLHLPALPFADPVLIFALAMVVFLVVPLVFERFQIPGLIGLIVAGAVIGDNGLGLLQRDSTIELFGTVGLLYLMFLVGLELDLEGVRRHKSHTITFGLLSFGLPLGFGIGAALALGYSLRSAALIGAMLSSHTAVAYPIASRLGIVKTQAVTTALGATLIVDLLALLVLAIVSKSSGGALDTAFWIGLLAPLVVYVAVVLVVLPRVTKWFYRAATAEGPTEYLFTLAALFIFSYLAHLAGIEPVIGALLVGFALNRLIPEQSPLMNRIKFVAESIFVPFFLLSVGMLIDLRAFVDPAAWLPIATIVVAAVSSKGLAAFITTKLFRYGGDDGRVMFGLSVSRAAATIAIALVGYRLGVIDQAVVNAVAMMILATCIIGPAAVQRSGRRVALREEQKPYAPSATPDRVLIPISSSSTREALLDLSFILRGSSSEPILPLMVVGSGADPEAEFAAAERSLRHAVNYAAGADVPVHPLTRVDPNVASGIARAIVETRANLVVIGWQGKAAASRYGIQRIFGTVLDQLLELTTQKVVVAKLGHPLNTTDRIVTLCPPASLHHPGFSDAARRVKHLAQSLGAELVLLVVEDDPAKVSAAFASLPPSVTSTAIAVPSFDDVLSALERRLAPNDLVVVLSSRRGLVSWHPKLERLPKQLVRLVPESVLVIYPGLRDPSARADEPAISDETWPAGLSAARVVDSLPDHWRDAIRHILRSHFDDGPALEETLERIVRAHDDFSAEFRPGVVVPHARVEGIEEPLVFLGISEPGVAFPHTDNPAHAVFVLLSPVGDPEKHLRGLAELSRLVSDEPRLAELLRLAKVDSTAILRHIRGA